MKRLPMSWTRVLLLFLAAALISGCEGVGEGNKPETATLIKLGNRVSSARLYTCFSESMLMLVTFSKGQVGDFSSRGKWKSSNPDVLFVSNYGESLPANLLASGESSQVFLAGGLLYPLKAGTATITATAAGLSASKTVEVRDPTEFKVRAVGYNDPDAAVVHLGTNTLQALQLTAQLDGYTLDQTGGASWEFVNPDTTIASFVTDSSGAATRVIKTTEKTGGPLRARPVLRGCSSSGSLLSTVGIDVNVGAVKELALKRELDAAKNVDSTGLTTMAVNTNEILQVFGRFDTNGDGTADHTGQNLSAQVLADSTNEGVLLPGLYGLPSALLAVSTGGTASAPKDISDAQTVTFCVPKPLASGSTTQECSDVKLATAPFKVRTDTLNSFTIASSTGTNEIQQLGTLQLRASGKFASGLEQDITRNVAWSSSDPAVVSIGGSDGLAQSLKPENGSATITGTNSNVTAGTTQTLTLSVVAPTP